MTLQTAYEAASTRYGHAENSGVLLPRISLGLWKGFGGNRSLSECQDLLHTAFDHGIVHFDLAHNYGPPYGSAEENFGRVMQTSFRPYRDELFIATKAVTTCGPDLMAIGVRANI